MGRLGAIMKLRLGLKSDPIEYRYSFPWLFRIMADEGVTSLQLGSFFEVYQLADSYFEKLRKQADDYGITIDSLFTAHRELGGFFREDPEWVDVARRNYERFIEVGAILGAQSVGSNPGAVPRDLMGLKDEGVARYIAHMKELMHFAHDKGVAWLTIEPMSCLAEPPTLPDEIRAMGDELVAYHAANPTTTARVGYCTDIAHGYIDAQGNTGYDHVALFEATIPYLYEIHLKNTDNRFHSTFGFGEENLKKGIINVGAFRESILANAASIPVDEMGCYLEIGGPKLGRDYTDVELEDQIRESLRYLKTAFLPGGDSGTASPAKAAINGLANRPVQIAPSMMCVDPLNFESALRRVEALGVDMLHMDVMDGHFVPNAPMGTAMVTEVAKRTHLPVDVHLMVADNDFFLSLLSGAKVAQISVHAESCTHLDRTLDAIRERGAKAGLAINPATPLSVLDYALERIDYVLIMTVNPGFAGQTMTPASLRKIADCRKLLTEHGYPEMPIQVDGNVSFANIPGMVAAGADNLVAGTSSIFSKAGGMTENLRNLEVAITNGLAQRGSIV